MSELADEPTIHPDFVIQREPEMIKENKDVPEPPSPPPGRRFKDTKRNKKSKRNMETFRVIEEGGPGETRFFVEFKHRFMLFFTYWTYAEEYSSGGYGIRRYNKVRFLEKQPAIDWAIKEISKPKPIKKEVYYHGYRMPEYQNPPPAPEKTATA